MKVGAAIYSMLKDDSAVSALVGTRIYPELAEEGAATPYVVYSVVSNTPIDTKDSAPVDEAQLEVFSVADTYAAANDLADKVRAALSRQEKVVYDTVTVQSIKYTNEVTEVSAERNLFISVQDYTARTVGVIARPDYLFDNYSGALFAYSLRQLNGDYTGAAIRVQRESDDTYKDIGFDAYGSLDLHALRNFCAGTNGRILRWFDQSGNGYDAEQSSEDLQPDIVANGVVTTENSRPALDWVNDALTVSSLSHDAANYSLFAVSRNTANNRRLFDSNTATIIDSRTASHGVYYNSGWHGTAFSHTTQALTSVHLVSPSSGSSYLNGTATNTDLTYTQRALSGVTRIGAKATTDSNHWDGTMQEIVLYASDQTANRTGIESNINTYYNIY